MKRKRLSLFVTMLLCQGAWAADPTLIATSGAAPVQLLELYTSEGCSSCPPADQWVSELKTEPGLWKSFVPVVFHVDYWNYLGWKDELSSKAMTQRQNEIARTWPTPAVYTPGMVVDGKEWQEWRGSRHVLPKKSAASNIVLSVFRLGDGSYRVKAEHLDPAQKYVLHLADLGMDLKTEVTGGENSGRSLQHNFVVLNWNSQNIDGKKAETIFTLKNPVPKTGRHALAAWIEKEGNPAPLQATGGYL